MEVGKLPLEVIGYRLMTLLGQLLIVKQRTDEVSVHAVVSTNNPQLTHKIANQYRITTVYLCAIDIADFEKRCIVL